jgi:hypothetical protein
MGYYPAGCYYRDDRFLRAINQPIPPIVRKVELPRDWNWLGILVVVSAVAVAGLKIIGII